MVYVSTSGVYGDCAGERVDESRPLAPQTERAKRRLDAERQLALWCNARGAALVRAQMPEPSSFMMESRRLDNRKLKQVLGLRLLYPSVHEGLRHAEAAGVH